MLATSCAERLAKDCLRADSSDLQSFSDDSGADLRYVENWLKKELLTELKALKKLPSEQIDYIIGQTREPINKAAPWQASPSQEADPGTVRGLSYRSTRSR
jgi:hypothetical protein